MQEALLKKVGAQLTGGSYTQGSSPCRGYSVHSPPAPHPDFSLIKTWNKKVETVCATEEHAVMQSTLTLQNEIEDLYFPKALGSQNKF